MTPGQAARLRQDVETVTDASERKEARIVELETAVRAVVHTLTYGQASAALHRSSLTLDDETRADLRWCLGRLRMVLEGR